MHRLQKYYDLIKIYKEIIIVISSMTASTISASLHANQGTLN